MTEYPLELDVNAVRQLQTSGEPFLLLDCREADEVALVRIEGSRHIPLKQIPERLAELEAFRQQRVVIHCHHGGRSMMATRWLRAQGFAGAQNMAGGIDAWAELIQPELPRY